MWNNPALSAAKLQTPELQRHKKPNDQFYKQQSTALSYCSLRMIQNQMVTTVAALLKRHWWLIENLPMIEENFKCKQ